MAAEIDSKFAKEQKVWIKRAMKGRALHFGLQAQGAKKGKLCLSNKPGDVKAEAVKDLKPYKAVKESVPKDKEDAEKNNTVTGAPSLGVCKGENGVLKLYFEKGKALPVAEKFVRYFITRELKYKAVKRVEIVEADKSQIPGVVEKDPADDPVTGAAVKREFEQLSQELNVASFTSLSEMQLAVAAKGKLDGLLESAKPPDLVELIKVKLTSFLSFAGVSTDNSRFEDADNALLTLNTTLALVKQLETVAGRVLRLRKELETLKKSGKLTTEQHEMESLVAEAEQKVAAATRALSATDEDVEATAPEDLRDAELLVERAEKIKTGPGPLPSTDQNKQYAEFFADWQKGLVASLNELKQSSSPMLGVITDRVKEVTEFIKTQDWTQAVQRQQIVDQDISEALRASRQKREGLQTAKVQTAVSSGLLGELTKKQSTLHAAFSQLRLRFEGLSSGLIEKARTDLTKESELVEKLLSHAGKLLGLKLDMTDKSLATVQQAHTQAELKLTAIAKALKEAESTSPGLAPLSEDVEDAAKMYPFVTQSCVAQLGRLQSACRMIAKDSLSDSLKQAAEIVRSLLTEPMKILQAPTPSNKKTCDAVLKYINASTTLEDAEKAGPKVGLEINVRERMRDALTKLRDRLPA